MAKEKVSTESLFDNMPFVKKESSVAAPARAVVSEPVKSIPEPIPAPAMPVHAPVVSAEVEQESVAMNNIQLLRPAKKETKSIRKSFAIKASLDRKFRAKAKEFEMTENELINTILEQVLN